MRAAVESGELSSEFECVRIVNQLRITPPVPQPENLDEKCRVSCVSCGTYCHMLSHEINLFLDLTSNMWFSKELNKKI